MPSTPPSTFKKVTACIYPKQNVFTFGKRIAFEQKPRESLGFLFRCMDALASIINQLIQSLEWVMFTLIVGGGLFLLVQSRGYALQHVGSGWRLLFQKENTQRDFSFRSAFGRLGFYRWLGEHLWSSHHCYMGGPGVYFGCGLPQHWAP